MWLPVVPQLLQGPTIVRYHDSWIEDETINIVMEYAEGGSLYQRIRECRERAETFHKEQIMGTLLW